MEQVSMKAMEVEVFKTDVVDPEQAILLKDRIEENFQNCKVNFDLEDCDRILRIKYEGRIQPELLIELLRNNGCTAEVLPDVIETISLEALTK